MTARILIQTPRAKRDFGIDTTQMAIGVLPTTFEGGDGLRLSRREYHRITRLLIKASSSRFTGKPFPLLRKFHGRTLACKIIVSCTRGEAVDAEDLNHVREFVLDILTANGHQTPIILRTQADTNGCFWLNARGNPTKLVNGYNALGIALRGKTRARERSQLLREPFAVLRKLLRKLDPKFKWEPETAERIQRLQFKACPVQVFTYMKLGEFTCDQFLGFLRVILNCPLGDGQKHYCLLSDLLELEVDSKVTNGQVETLLIKFMRAGRVEMSVNLYDKSALACADAEKAQVNLGGPEVEEFLRQHIRVDISLNDPALRALISEAKLGRKEDVLLTASMFNDAISTLDRLKGKSGKRFVPWLLSHIFNERLPLLQLLRYRPDLPSRVHETLQEDEGPAAAVFKEWWDLGFQFTPPVGDGERSVSFNQFGMKHATTPVSRQTARTINRKARAHRLNLDIPLAAYEALYTMTHFFDLSAEDRQALNAALHGNQRADVLSMLKRSRSNSLDTINRVRQAMEAMIASAHVPARRIRAPAPSK